MRTKKFLTPNVLKAGLLGFAVVLLSACSAAMAAGENKGLYEDLLNDVDAGPIMVAAHRGCWTTAPENTVTAIDHCVKLGVEIVEIDVQLTKDRELIVFHDRTLDRMTNGHGPVWDATLAEIKSLRLYERDGSPSQINEKKLITNHKVATLREMFEATRGRILLNLEIKSNDVFGFEETYQAALDLARDMGVENEVLWKIPSTARAYDVEIVDGFSGSEAPDTPADVIYNAIDTKGLRHVTPIVWHGARSFEQSLQDFSDTPVKSFEIIADDPSQWPLGPDGRIIGADKYRYLGIAVLPRWSAGYADDIAMSDPDASWGRLIDIGADVIMTDRPEQLIEYLEERGLR